MLHIAGKPFQELVNIEQGTVDRAVFSDQDIYEMELERIFARAWNFMCHESQIKKPGDFFLSYIGEESVIATRDKKGELQVLLNSCRHRGNAVCRAESGNARSFLCTYHGWTYGLDGSLIGVPGYKDFYHEQLDKSQWGLVRAAKVASYKGFVFATMDPEAPDLEEYLGPVGKIGLDFHAARGELEVVDGVQKNLIGCNWKLAVDNIYDFYHAQVSHASAYMSGFRKLRDPLATETPHYLKLTFRSVLGDYGHAIGGPKVTPQMLDDIEAKGGTLTSRLGRELFRRQPGVADILGEVGVEAGGHPGIFPNTWVAAGQICVRMPRGPGQTELWWFTLAPKDASPEDRYDIVHMAEHNFGPAGLLEQDDGENWDQSTRAAKGVIAGRYPLHFAMGMGQGEVRRANDTTFVDSPINEYPQFWTYRAWAEWMDAPSWAALKADHTRAPVAGVI